MWITKKNVYCGIKIKDMKTTKISSGHYKIKEWNIVRGYCLDGYKWYVYNDDQHITDEWLADGNDQCFMTKFDCIEYLTTPDHNGYVTIIDPSNKK